MKTFNKHDIKKLKQIARLCRGDILKMTYVANSGHPGGSMSSLEIFLSVFSFANLNPDNPYDPLRDRVVVSHGHTSPGVYSVLGRLGFVDIDQVIAGFRHHSSIFEGHVTRGIPGVEWTTGNLGQGLSAGVGFALAAKMKEQDYHIFVAMSDAEQAKGQVAEARRVAKKYGLSNLTVVIDYNDAQISGRARDVMPVNIRKNYEADGWRVLEVDGHDIEQLLHALSQAVEDKVNPVAILAHTIMGKGVSFMENDVSYHGKPLDKEQLEKALNELGIDNDVEKYMKMRAQLGNQKHEPFHLEYPVKIKVPAGRTYTTKTDNRSAFGNALLDLVKENRNSETPVVAVDCDLATSVKLDGVQKYVPERFLELGVQEHNAAAVAGALSADGVVTFFADFGVFGVSETYNQHRLNAINHTNLKVIVTHCGLNVGEDGKTHHGLDYISAPANWLGYKVIVPADPNQTDRVIRYIASVYGNYLVAMGRAKMMPIVDENGKLFFADNYRFEYGKIDILRKGTDVTVVTCGSVVPNVVEAADKLRGKVSVLNVSCPLDLDEHVLREYGHGKKILVVEDHVATLGLTSLLAKFFLQKGIIPSSFEQIAIQEHAVSGSYEALYEIYGLSSTKIAEKLGQMIS
ncbi:MULTISPECIES: transketolase [Pseudothermotoga]|jgi:transketolase|uniref:Transketolase domain protein n=1 Tax=Pseudothermotoga lettingae (strain ATCC BAA-301 / DSM 14385 / NBRC 107922 / TMO) TaxID=416591 RepID=A8F398_PSELT|nr:MULTISPECIES: transketolase [Pseudothermotoga]ABV32632.1 Transketolase domain protein [Pseudothermotoga lettingae TMO]KUK20646.1 MAG: Transketolase domain protein [Pseudothermotoga lettingae]MDI3494733.1 transketolase [Pseudothermotoga sp.]MDK2885108.1 transketolase [Pseudothermotoga sp.]GLI48377.1 transketolase [Pseudothermotoga lettingae TMO]